MLDRYHTDLRARRRRARRRRRRRGSPTINERLATLGTAFSQNVLADEQGYTLVLDGEDDLAGLPDFVRAAARAAAEERGLAGKHVITLSRSSVEPFLQFSARRDLREKAFRAWIARGDDGGATDNKAIIAEMVALRAERARLLGYADLRPLPPRRRDGEDAGGGARAARRCLAAGARARALADRDAMQALVAGGGRQFRARAVGLALLRREAAQGAAATSTRRRSSRTSSSTASSRRRSTPPNRLFGLTLRASAHGVPVWHPDVRVWEVRGSRMGAIVGLFFGDYFARPSKRSGAWMTTLRDQEKLGGDIRPLVVNVMNFSKAREGRADAALASTTPAPCSTSSATRCTACCPTSPIR